MPAEAPVRPSGMVGKKELLGWVSDMCGRPVVSFSELKDGDALVRCVKETWPLAYDECRPRFPKRMDGTRDPKENFELIKAIFAKLRLPPEALDVRGVRASAFKPCYNFLVVCFFLRNLALHSDFSVDFTHPVDSTLAQFLQSPASVASLRTGGALPPSPEKEKKRAAEFRPRRPTPNAAPAARVASAKKGQRSARSSPAAAASPPERSTPGLGAVFRPPSSSRGSRGSIGGANAFPADVATPERDGTEPRRAPEKKNVARRAASDSLGRFMRRRGAGGGGVEETSRGDVAREADVEPGSACRDEDEEGKKTDPSEDVETTSADDAETPVLARAFARTTTTTTTRRTAADAEDLSSRLASARFEADGLRRVLRGLKSERDDVVTRYEAEMDALRAQSAADAESIRAAEKRRRRELESRFAEERAEDQRAFLRELRAVADEFSTVDVSEPSTLGASRDEDGVDVKTASARKRVALEAARGREIAALETRVSTLEKEREGLLLDLAAATSGDSVRRGDQGDDEIRRLRSELRLTEARHVADASSRAREIDELRLELRVAKAELSDAKHARRFVSVSKDVTNDEKNDEKNGLMSTFSALLGEHRDARRVARLEAEAKQAADVAAALRKQVDALLLDEGTSKKTTETTHPANEDEAENDDHEPDDDSHAAAFDAGAVLRAVAVLRDLALEPPYNDVGGDEVAAETKDAVAAAARAAEAAAWRRAAAAAVSRRRLLRARAATAEARARVVSLETKVRDVEALGAEREASLRRRARDAEEDLARERAAGGVRAALAEEAERLARSEAEEARREAADARASASAAHGASKGALRDARDEAAKLRLREQHWVGLVECHREAASASRAIAERVASDENTSDDLAARTELETIARRRVELEAEAARHAEAIEAVAAMLPEEIRSGASKVRVWPGDDEKENLSNAHELARLEARASAAEAAAEALRVRLARKTEDAAALALRAKRQELRAEEAATAAKAGARERREVLETARRKQAETEEVAQRLRLEASQAKREASAAKAALEDRDAALDVGVTVVRANPELARSMMRRDSRESADENDGESAGDDSGEDSEEDIAETESFGGFEIRKSVPDVPAGPGGIPAGSPARSPLRSAKKKSARKTRKTAAGALTSPEAVAAAVAEATRAIATTPGSVESRAFGSARTTSKNDEAFANLDDVVSPPRRAFSKKTVSKSPGGESVGSVGAATPSKGFFAGFASPSARDVDDAVDALARDAADSVTPAGSPIPDGPRSSRKAEENNRAPPVPASPFRRFLDAFSPRRGGGNRNSSSPGGNLSPSVEEETEDSEATDPGETRERQGEGDANDASERAREPISSTYRVARRETVGDVSGMFPTPSPARASATAGLTSYSPLPNDVSVSAVTSLPGASTFMRDAEAHLDIEVKKSWFGLKDDASETPTKGSPSSRRAE